MRNSILKKLLYSLVFSLIFTIFVSNIAYAAGKPAVSKTSFDLLVGKTYDLDIKNVAKNASCEWSSSNKKIATVDKNGLVKGKAKGSAVITCKVKSSGKTYSLKSNVNVITPAKTVTLPNTKLQLKVGETATLEYKLSPSSSNDKVTWSSGDKAVVTVDAKGKLTAKKVGIANITAVTMSGAKATVSVAVYDDSLLRITAEDVKDKKVVISNQTISFLYIENSVQYAEITLDNVKITGAMTIEAGTEFIVKADNSTIAVANVISPKDPSTIRDKERPTLFAGKKTGIWLASLQASCVLKEADSTKIDKLAISPALDGDYDMYVSAHRGDLVVDYSSNSKVRIELEGCTINKADIMKANGEYMILTSNVKMPSKIKTINIKAETLCCIDVEADTVNIDKSLKKEELLIANKINKLVNNGADIGFMAAEDAYIGEIIDNKRSDGKYGAYTFRNSEMGNIAFTVLIGGFPIEGLQLKDFGKIFDAWTDKSKPFADPQMPGVSITCTAKNTYELNMYGAKINLIIDIENGAITIKGSDIFKLTDIVIVKG